MTNFMANDWDRANCLKRGRDFRFISIDAENGEGKYRREPVETATPELLFERTWAQTVIARVSLRLREEYSRAGELVRFERLKEFLMGETESSYASVTAGLGLSEGGVKTSVRRMRLRFRDLLREELAQTLEDNTQVDDEIRHLLLSLTR